MAAALKLWARTGYDATPMEAIAREAGLSKGTLYLYFEGKQALLDEVVVRRSLLPDLERLLPAVREEPLTEIVANLVHLVWERLEEERDVVRVLVRELSTHLEHAQTLIERVVLPTNRLFAALLSEKLGPDRSAEIDTLVAGRGLFGMVLVWFVTQEILGGAQVANVAPEAIQSTIAEVFLHGVLGRPT